MADNLGLLSGLAQGVKGALEGYEKSTLANEKKKELEAKRKADEFDRMIKTNEFKVKAGRSGYDVQEDEQGNIKGLLPKKGFLDQDVTKRRQETLKAGFIPDESGNISLDASGQPVLAKYKQDEIQNRGLLQQARIQSAQANAKLGKAPTEGQFKAATFSKRMRDAENVFDSLTQKGYDPTAFKEQAAGTLSGIFGEGIKSSDLKQLQQAQRNFITAVLRRESGAAIADSEFENAKAQYFPQPGDSPSVLDQKKKNRMMVIAALEAEGEPAMERIGRAQSAQTVQPKTLSAEDQQAIQWANSNPNDPRAKQIKQRLGM